MNLKERAENQVQDRFEWLHQAEQAARKVDDLPQTIQELNGSADCNFDGSFSIALFGGDAHMQVCQAAGAVFDEPRISTSSGDFKVKGQLGNTKIEIFFLSVPPQCHVEKELHTVYRYKAVCNETKEEPKLGGC